MHWYNYEDHKKLLNETIFPDKHMLFWLPDNFLVLFVPPTKMACSMKAWMHSVEVYFANKIMRPIAWLQTITKNMQEDPEVARMCFGDQAYRETLLSN